MEDWIGGSWRQNFLFFFEGHAEAFALFFFEGQVEAIAILIIIIIIINCWYHWVFELQ
jgi:hypothetical protein